MCHFLILKQQLMRTVHFYLVSYVVYMKLRPCSNETAVSSQVFVDHQLSIYVKLTLHDLIFQFFSNSHLLSLESIYTQGAI